MLLQFVVVVAVQTRKNAALRCQIQQHTCQGPVTQGLSRAKEATGEFLSLFVLVLCSDLKCFL